MHDTSLEAAYRAALYVVELPGGSVALRVDEPSPALRDWLRGQPGTCAALLTAHNPAGRQQDAQANDRAQAELLRILVARGHALAPGSNRDPAGLWPDERSVLAAGVPQAEALALARRFGQNALLWMAGDGIPRLVWTAAA